jgi:hypothetical protein
VAEQETAAQDSARVSGQSPEVARPRRALRGRRGPLAARRRERIADWSIVIGAVGLFVSLFLTWSHQFSAAFLAEWGSSYQLIGVPHDPTAWQLFSATDVLLALLAAGLLAIALIGGRTARLVAIFPSGIALAFALHALSTPPTNGANIFDPSLSVPAYFPNSPTAGIGVTFAIVALCVALLGLVLSSATE